MRLTWIAVLVAVVTVPAPRVDVHEQPAEYRPPFIEALQETSAVLEDGGRVLWTGRPSDRRRVLVDAILTEQDLMRFPKSRVRDTLLERVRYLIRELGR